MQTREATGGVHNGTAPVDPAAVREELERILASPQFRNSKRHSCFLRLVVEETLNGEAGQLKERTVGVRVFGLEPGYDTSTNPVVRVSAGELRKRLLQYYHAPDHGAEPRIDLPPGSYVPEFGPAPVARLILAFRSEICLCMSTWVFVFSLTCACRADTCICRADRVASIFASRSLADASEGRAADSAAPGRDASSQPAMMKTSNAVRI